MRFKQLKHVKERRGDWYFHGEASGFAPPTFASAITLSEIDAIGSSGMAVYSDVPTNWSLLVEGNTEM